MTHPRSLRSRADFLNATGVLLVVRDPPPANPPAPGQPAAVPGNPAEGVEILLALWADGRVTALHGHVDLGTGIKTAFAQIVAEELDVSLEQVEVILGDTGTAPNQGPTIASGSLQNHAAPLRAAAAQARQYLLELAAARFAVPTAQLTVRAGVVSLETSANPTQLQTSNASGTVVQTTTEGTTSPSPSLTVSYATLLAGQRLHLKLELTTPVKDPSNYRTVGQSSPRVDIPAKATGELVFVHDVRVPGMLHGRVIRPPYAGADHGDFIGNLLESVDEASIAHIPGIRAVVVIRDFIGVVAEREEFAELAANTLRVNWKPWAGLPELSNIEQALRNNPATPRQLVDEGDVDQALAQAAQSMPRTYIWPYQMHASIGPSCAVAEFKTDPTDPFALTVWAGTQNPHVLRADLARLTALQDTAIEIIRMEASGCYGRNGADDVAADAVLLARAVGAPVRVQLTREQENLWEPKGAAQWMEVRGGLHADGSIAAYDFSTSYPSNGAPTLALLLTRTLEPNAQAYEMGDRTARPPYTLQNLRVTVNDMPPILRASWLRGVSAMPNSFAHESYIDELATAAGVDPLTFRLRYLDDPRARELLQATAAKAGWKMHDQPQQQGAEGDVLHGQGIAWARYVHSKWPGFGAAWAAWIADVEVNKRTGEVHVKRVVVGHDAGLTINPAGVEHQIHGNVVQTTSRAMIEQVPTEREQNTVATREWGSYPILSFRQVPVIEVMQMPRHNEPALGAGESASVPGTAAIANAIFDATGVRFRQPPFTPEVVRAALNPLMYQGDSDSYACGNPQLAAQASDKLQLASQTTDPLQASPANQQTDHADARWPKPRSWWLRAAALTAALGTTLLGATWSLFGQRTALAPVAQPIATYSAATLERGRELAALGNCVTCHTSAQGKPNAGGLGIQTPFGTVYSTNLTPDPQTGIGLWSQQAFNRAMREGISRDGHHLYPAFPYTSFTRTSDEDLTALYGWLMSQEPVRQATPETKLAFPFSLRPLMAFWNALYLTPGSSAKPLKTEVERSPAWLRGEYLVNGLGHCSACHTSRDALGGERSGLAYLSGATVDGWQAPALNARSPSPVPWTETAFYDYLRNGHSAEHGSASGPMAPVIRQLAQVPDTDLAAMAHYLASFQEQSASALVAQTYVAQAAAREPMLLGPAQRMFQAACASCHHDGDGPRLLGVNIPLALSTGMHSAQPDNVIRVILEGIRKPASEQIGFMQGFAKQFDDQQLSELLTYMRSRFAPTQPPWQNLEQKIGVIRMSPSLHLP
ncbi:Aldehyde oxidase/xanthine dehydrogenase, molybdopterin binding [Burkholderiaceae bacterium]